MDEARATRVAGDAIGKGDRRVLVAAQDESTAVMRGGEFRASCCRFRAIAVHESMRADLVFAIHRKGQGHAIQQLAKAAIVVSRNEDDFRNRSHLRVKAAHLYFERFNVDGVVYHVTEEDDALTWIGSSYQCESIEWICVAAEWQKVTSAAVRPGVTEMGIGDEDCARFREPHRASRIQHDARCDFKALRSHRTAVHSTTDGRVAPAWQMGLRPTSLL